LQIFQLFATTMASNGEYPEDDAEALVNSVNRLPLEELKKIVITFVASMSLVAGDG